MNFAYCRVSTNQQDFELQKQAMTESRYPIDEFFSEKLSGKTANRPKLNEMLNKLRSNDKVIVTKLDRIARSLKDLLEISATITAKDADLVILDQNIDTSSPSGRLVFSILGALAEFERSLIIERTSQGRMRAIERGIKMGRKPKTDENSLILIKGLHTQGKSYTEIAAATGLSRSSVYRKLKNLKLIDPRMQASSL